MGRLATLEDVEHLPLGAASAIVALHPHPHDVAMQNRAHLLRRQIDADGTVIGDHEAVPVAVALHHTVDLGAQAHRILYFACHACNFDAIVTVFADCSEEKKYLPRWRNW